MHQKTCFKCHISKPYSEFYKHRMMLDGHLGKCKSCAKRDADEREKRLSKDPSWKEKELARHREKSARARKLGEVSAKEVWKKSRAAWILRNKHKRYAHGKVAFAIHQGSLTRQPCEVCGEMKAQAHHDDYSKPLEVKWLCTKHHGERHVELNRLKREYK